MLTVAALYVQRGGSVTTDPKHVPDKPLRCSKVARAKAQARCDRGRRQSAESLEWVGMAPCLACSLNACGRRP